MQVLEHEPQPQWQLSDNQWGKVKASPYFDRYPGAKLLPRRAIFQTLQSSYKTGYMVYSQFVPQPPPANPRFFTPREVPHARETDSGTRALAAVLRRLATAADASCPSAPIG